MVKAARRQLREFEQRAAFNPQQPDLFASLPEPEIIDPEPHPVVAQLAALNPDELTPKQALEALYELRGKVLETR